MSENKYMCFTCSRPLQTDELLTCQKCKQDYENSKCSHLDGFTLGQKVRYMGPSEHMKREKDGSEMVWHVTLLLKDSVNNDHSAQITSYHPTSGGSWSTLVSIKNIC